VFEVVYANDNFWPAGAAYPGESELAEQAEVKCQEVFTAYVGVPQMNIYTFTDVEPVTSASWASGLRGLQCVAYRPDSASPDGEMTITHSVKATGQ
jgi:hypothetical protein